MSLHAHDVAAFMADERPVEANLTHPNDLQMEIGMRENVWSLIESDDPENTKKAFLPKMKEYFEFCKAVYPNDPHFEILQRDHIYRFMYFQAFRNKKKRGGKRSNHANKPAFDVEAYREVMSGYSDPSTGVVSVALPTPTCPVSHCTIAVYKAVFRKIYSIQKMRGVLCAQWDDLWTKYLNDIEKHVKEQAPKIKKETYQEKVSNEFTPYLYVEQEREEHRPHRRR